MLTLRRCGGVPPSPARRAGGAGRGLFESGDHPQRRRLPAARRAEQREELPRGISRSMPSTAMTSPNRLVSAIRLISPSAARGRCGGYGAHAGYRLMPRGRLRGRSRSRRATVPPGSAPPQTLRPNATPLAPLRCPARPGRGRPPRSAAGRRRRRTPAGRAARSGDAPAGDRDGRLDDVGAELGGDARAGRDRHRRVRIGERLGLDRHDLADVRQAGRGRTPRRSRGRGERPSARTGADLHVGQHRLRAEPERVVDRPADRVVARPGTRRPTASSGRASGSPRRRRSASRVVAERAVGRDERVGAGRRRPPRSARARSSRPGTGHE